MIDVHLVAVFQHFRESHSRERHRISVELDDITHEKLTELQKELGPFFQASVSMSDAAAFAICRTLITSYEV